MAKIINYLTVTAFFVSIFLTGCSKKEEQLELKLRIAELEKKIEYRQEFARKMSYRMQKVNHLLDSINRSEKEITLNLSQGTPISDHVDRVRGLSAFVEYTRQKLVKMERELAETEVQEEKKLLKAVIDRLRLEVHEKDKLIKTLNVKMAKFKNTDRNIIHKSDLQADASLKKDTEGTNAFSFAAVANRYINPIFQSKAK